MNLLFGTEFSANKTVIVLCAVLAVACIDIIRRIKHRPSHLFFATVLSTALSIGIIRTVDLFLQPGMQDNPYAMAFAVVLIAIAWKALFGSWDVQVKVTILATFLFWISLKLFWDDSPQEQYVRLIAAATALIPAGIWCMLFLKYHHERLSNVILLFLAGMLSTVPILFYDMLVRRGIELKFFLFSITPESFTQAAHSFVNGQLTTGNGSQSLIIATLISFTLVGFIEEASKGWVLIHSGRKIFTSIDDVMQLSIVTAIGFAFAENIINPTYFTAFVREHLFHTGAPDIGAFIGNVLGRSVLTSMVHILSTGVLGYFLGLSIFAGPYLTQEKSRGHMHRLLTYIHRLFRLPEVSIFRVEMLVLGLLSAIGLHGLFNFIVTLPDILPSHPESVGDIFGGSGPAFLEYIPFLLIPALLYVVGGFWLLTFLFLRKENMKEHGHLVLREEFVSAVVEEEKEE